jgi:hypothetical protein
LGVHDGKFAFSCEAVLGKGILLAVIDISVIEKSARDGEKQGSLTAPECGVALPDIFFLRVIVLQGRKLCAHGIHANGEKFIFDRDHLK